MIDYVTKKSEMIREKLLLFPKKDDIQETLDHLLNVIHTKEYTAVVLGEFNAGKTSFINAFLGEKYLPVGMTPTTSVIYEVRYGERSFVEIRKKDTTKVRVPEGIDSLEDYLKVSQIQPQEIQSVYIEQPLDMLSNEIVLVDTPGLNDLEHARPEVTYQYLPKADVVFFVINSNMPLRKTELDFIRDDLLEQGIEQVIIVLTRIDQLDDEEIDEVIDGVYYRLSDVIKKYQVEIPIVAISNIEALEAQQTKDKELYELSGMQDVREIMTEYFETSRQQEVKRQRITFLYKRLLQDISELMRRQLEVNQLTFDELHEQLSKVDAMKIEAVNYYEEYDLYVRERQVEVYQMLDRSLEHFYEELSKEIKEELNEYDGPDFVQHAEKQVPRQIERAVKSWLDQYAQYLQLFIQKVGDELYTSSADIFDDLRHESYQTKMKDDIDFVRIQRGEDTKKFFDDGTVAATVYGGAGILLVSLGAPVILPALALVGLPKLREFFSEYNKKKHLPEIIQWVDQLLEQHQVQMGDLLKEYVHSEMLNLLSTFKKDFEEELHAYEQMMKNQLMAIEGDQSLLKETHDQQLEAYNFIMNLQNEALELMLEETRTLTSMHE